MQIIKTIFAGCFLIWMLGVASCAMLGYGTTVMVESMADSKTAKKISKKASDWELKMHNDRANREASYHTRDDYIEEYQAK